jgi:hypothetical protein
LFFSYVFHDMLSFIVDPSYHHFVSRLLKVLFLFYFKTHFQESPSNSWVFVLNSFFELFYFKFSLWLFLYKMCFKIISYILFLNHFRTPTSNNLSYFLKIILLCHLPDFCHLFQNRHQVITETVFKFQRDKWPHIDGFETWEILPLFLFTLHSGISQSQTMSTLTKYVKKSINIKI